MWQQKTSTQKLLILLFAILIALAGCQSVSNVPVKTKSAANEASAVAALRTIASAQAMYSTTHEGDFGTFEELVGAGNLDTRFSGDRPIVGGYVLTIKIRPKDSGGNPASYEVNADPQSDVAAGSTGNRHLYVDSKDSVIRVNAKQAASSSDPQL